MKQPVVIWAGPVNAAQVPDATIPGAQRFFLNCTGDGSTPPRCSSFNVRGGDGRMLPGILSRFGLSEDQVGDIFLGAFSAGGQIWKPLLTNPADRRRVRGILMHDAAYETSPSSNPQPSAGYVAFAEEALRDPSKFMLMTASVGQNPSVEQPGVIYQSGAETMRATVAEIERQTGMRIPEGGSLPFGLPVPTRLWKRGDNLFFAQYDNVPHGGQALMAPEFWQKLLVPWTVRAPSSSGDLLPMLLVTTLGVGLGYMAAEVLGD